jgi:hypothetical protein
MSVGGKVNKMWVARWDSGTGFGVVNQPLTLAFFHQQASEAAVRMGGHVKKGFDIVPVTVTIEDRNL